MLECHRLAVARHDPKGFDNRDGYERLLFVGIYPSALRTPACSGEPHFPSWVDIMQVQFCKLGL